MNFEQARFNMIEQQIRPWDVLDPNVIAVLFRSRRELFVPADQRGLAHADMELPLGKGERMLAPKIEAHALQALQISQTDKVLEVGTGSGFMASLLGMCAAQVSSVEIDPDFVASARANLRQISALNVSVHQGDGLLGLPGDAPFDVILVSGAVHSVPKALLDQLKVGGRLFAIVGEAPAMQAQRITRRAADAWQTETLFETVAPYLHEPAGNRFRF
jgi:protein-L-isoaspartate(D-aspartate) O-methyltransferase